MWGPTDAEIAAICRRVGCSVARTERGGGARLLLCRSHPAKVALLDELGTHGAQQPAIRRFVELVASEVGGSGLALVAELHRIVRDGVQMLGEEQEVFSPAMRTLTYGVGDCDDQAIALLALFRAAGFEARPRTLGNPPRHVLPVVRVDGVWLDAEPTIRAHLGEPPLDAVRRLGIRARPDLGVS